MWLQKILDHLKNLVSSYSKILLFALLFSSLATISLAAQESKLSVRYHPDSVKTQLSLVFDELKAKHPGFYRYQDSLTFNAYIDSTLRTISQPVSSLEILRTIKPVFSKIGCLHTGIHMSTDLENELNKTANCFPLALYYDHGKAYIWKDLVGNSGLSLGEEIQFINGRSIQSIYEHLLASIPMDGYNITGKNKLLQYSFAQWYRSCIEVSKNFEVITGSGVKINLKATHYDQLLTYEMINKDKLRLEEKGTTFLLRVPSFAQSYYKSNGQNYKKELRNIFKNLEKQTNSSLIIDLRGNTGGSDSNAVLLASYLLDEPFRYWDRIEVTEAIAKEVTGMSNVFYGKPVLENGKWLWSDKGLASSEFKFTRIQDPGKLTYKGAIVLLTDGLCLSSCADLVAILRSNNRVTVWGEETGGGYLGNTSGLIPSEALNFELVIDVPLLKYFNHVESPSLLGRGTIPDHEIKPTVHDIISGNDPTLVSALKYLESK